jgi:glyoxylase-like metal-dependent hydrolase (beta-lactamase superfamily II)
MKQAELIKNRKVKTFEWGTFALDGGAMFGSVPKVLWSKLITPDETNRIPMALRSLYLEKDNMKVLVDLGMGAHWDEKLRKIYNLETSPLEDNLKKKLGISPADVTHIVLTHLHFDHCGFLSVPAAENSKNWTSAFKNAEIILCEENYTNALNPNTREAASYLPHYWSDPIKRGQVRLVSCKWLELREVLPGISIRRVDGHTVGQTIVYVDGVDQNYIFLADLCPTENHLKDVWVMGYDIQAGLSVTEKQRILSEPETLTRTLIFEHSVNTIFKKADKKN